MNVNMPQISQKPMVEWIDSPVVRALVVAAWATLASIPEQPNLRKDHLRAEPQPATLRTKA